MAEAPPPDSALVDFLARLLADRGRGRVLPLADYLRLYPGHQEQVAREYLRHAIPEPAGAPRQAGERRVGPYLLERELGRGGQAVVWLARDPRLDRLVALKVAPRSPAFEALAPRMEREAAAVSRLVHPGLATVYEVGSDAEHAWIAMRFVEGRTLAEELAAGPPSDPELRRRLVRHVEDAARALHAAHEAGVLHRDVKPSNLMVTPAREVVVVDFGIARREDDGALLTLSGAIGTPAYMSPEQLAGRSVRPDRRSDVWSLGVVLYECLTGRRPFDAPTHHALVRAIAEDEPPDPRRLAPEVSPDLAVIARTALSKEPERRYRTALDLAEDLRRARSHEAILARPLSPAARLLRWTRRQPALAASLAALLLALVAGLAVTAALLARSRGQLRVQAVLLDEVTRLADQTAARELIAEEATLWPADGVRAPLLARWIERADELLARRELHAGAAPIDPIAAPDSAHRTRAWLEEQRAALVAALDRLEPLRPKVARRLEVARSLHRATVEDQASAWARAAAELAADPRFAGVRLAPQVGLVPLGADPASGLQEFAAWQTGQVPARDASGRLGIAAESAMVLVLVPGGPTTLGSRMPDAEHPPGSPHVDPWTALYDGPPREVVLDPFLIGKHELTQGQWTRHTGANPSAYQTGSKLIVGPSDLHPVEQVSWQEAMRVLGELALTLPTEARWEHAVRAGATTPWSCGGTRECLQGHANVADRHARAHGGADGWGYEDGIDDGHTVHAPVGSYAPNAFGLHDGHGNVVEWCLDPWEDWRECPPRPGDGLTDCGEYSRALRGGNFVEDAERARCSRREGMPPHVGGFYHGLRAARDLVGWRGA